MDWITILAIVGVLVGAGLLFGTGCSIGRGFAEHRLNRERHLRLIEQVRRERVEKDNAELLRRLATYRGVHYAEAKVAVLEDERRRAARRFRPPAESDESAPGAA
jgi:hypothetical protein